MHYQDTHDNDLEGNLDPKKLGKKGKENDRSDNIFWKSTMVNFQEQKKCIHSFKKKMYTDNRLRRDRLYPI